MSPRLILLSLWSCTPAGPAPSGTHTVATADTADPENGGGYDTAGVAVTITRDARGVPHIQGDTDADAFYGLGWASAEDRLVQMTLYVRTMQGRMAEAQGSSFLPQDRQVRLEGWWRHAQAMADQLEPADKALLDAFAEGVNDYVLNHPDHGSDLLGPLGLAHEPWTAAHAILAWYRVANLFSGDAYSKAATYYAFEELEAEIGTEAAVTETLSKSYAGDSSTGVVQQEDVPQKVQDAIAAYALEHGYGAASFAGPKAYGHDTPKFSHAWAIAGSHTTSGHAILVSDPQTTVTTPSIWYEWQLQSPSYDVRGIGVAGSPGLLMGFNEHIAWGLTAAGADQRDLYRLEMTDADSYVWDGAVEDLTVETETILVAGDSPVELAYRESRLGPVVTELVTGNRGDEWALKATPFVHDDDTVSAVLAMMAATTLDELRGAVAGWQFPSANFVAASETGDIFFTVIGDIPLRSTASPLGGMIGQEGSASDYDWLDIIPLDVRPWVLNPAQGFLLSGNHRPAGDWYPVALGMGTGGIGDTTRSRRLRELLEDLDYPTDRAAVLSEVQADCVNSSRRDVVALARHAADQGDPGLGADALAFLSAIEPWSSSGASMDVGSTGALAAWNLTLSFREGDVSDAIIAQYGGSENGINYFLSDLVHQIALDPDYVLEADAVAYLDQQLADAWEAVSRSDPESWTEAYGQLGSWSASPFSSTLTGIGSAFTDAVTARVACPDGGTIQSQLGQSYTQAVDFSDEGALAVMPPGNTEDPGSSFFTAQLGAWEAGQLLAAPLGDAVGDDATGGVTTLAGIE